jgi:hypothetical protein
MPGCAQLVAIDSSAVRGSSNGRAELRAVLPNEAGQLGLSFFAQATVLDPAANFLGLTTSNAGEGIVGAR